MQARSSSVILVVTPSMEGDRRVGAEEEPRVLGDYYVSYVLVLFHMRFLNDKSQLCELSVN